MTTLIIQVLALAGVEESKAIGYLEETIRIWQVKVSASHGSEGSWGMSKLEPGLTTSSLT